MDFLQKMTRSYSMESKARKPTAHSHKESFLPNQTPHEYYKIKYETKYHPLLKKSKLLGFTVTKFFKLSNGHFLYANQKNAKKPLKTVPLKSITCFEVRPFAMGFDFCVEIRLDKGSACWAHCHTEHEKNFLIDYLSQNQTHHNRGSNFQSIQGPVQPGNNANSIDPPTSALEDIGFLNTEENIAVEVIPNQGQWTVEKRIQKYQRKSIKIGAKAGEAYLSQSFATVPKDISFDDSGSADGIDNKVPVLPQAKQIEKLYEYHESQSCLPLGERPSPRLNLDSLPLDIAKASNTEYLITEMCPPVRLKSAREGIEVTEEEAEGMNSIGRLKVPNLMNSQRRNSKRESIMTMKMSLPRQNSDLYEKKQSFTSNSPTHAKETCSTRDAKRSSKELEVQEEEEAEEEGFDIGKIKTLEECVEIGCKLMWQNELDKARECLNLYKERSYLVQLLDCECDLQEVCVSGLEVKVRQTLNKLVELSGRISSENSHFNKEDPNKHFEMELNKAEIYLAECILYCFLGNRFNAVKRVTDAWRAYRRVENLTKKKDVLSKLSKLNQHRYKFGQGCFSVAFSLFSSVLLKLGKLIGIKSDRAEGLRLLEECRQEQSIRSHYAALFLAVYKLEILALFEDASVIVTESLRESKGNSLFYWIGSLVCWKYTRVRAEFL